MRLIRAAAALAAVAVLSAASPASGETANGAGQDEQQAGLRAAAGEGVDADELFVRWPAPFLQQQLVSPYLPTGGIARWEVALSYWRADGDDATVFAIGPTLEYPLPWRSWSLSFGIQPTVFSDYETENRTLGGAFEFTSHLGARWRSPGAWYLGARVQHTSNAGIYDRNPGVNLFALEVGTRF